MKISAYIIRIGAVIMLGTAAHGDPLPKDIYVPNQKYTCYNVPESGGAALKLRVLRSPGVAKLLPSRIVLQDESDGVQWSPTSQQDTAHIYDIGVVLSGLEWVKIEGAYEREQGVGQGQGAASDNKFKANVAHLNVEKPLTNQTFMIDHDTMQINSPGIVCQVKAMLQNDETSEAKLSTNWKLLLSWTGGGTTYYTPGPTQNGKLQSSSNPFNVPASAFTTGGQLAVALEGAMDGVAFAPRSITGITIRMDEDPSNADFSSQLGLDIIRALAWKEGAVGYPGWSHYDGNGQPRQSGGDWGIIQINKQSWENWFNSSGNTPSGYTVAKWNVMAWNWKTHIVNGKYIHQTYMHEKQTSTQKTWPETAVDKNTPNREDLATYGYHNGEGPMRSATSGSWVDDVVGSDYTQDVRTYKSSQPWLL